MTTIAWDGKTIASDAQGGGAFIYNNGPKVFKHEGRLFGLAGDREACEVARKWILKNSEFHKDADRPRPDLGTESFGGLMIDPDGQCFAFEKRLLPFAVSTPHAEGSGGMFAQAAMLAGADAAEAVRIACELDPYSGGSVATIDLKGGGA